MCACASPPPISRSAWFITRPTPETSSASFAPASTISNSSSRGVPTWTSGWHTSTPSAWRTRASPSRPTPATPCSPFVIPTTSNWSSSGGLPDSLPAGGLRSAPIGSGLLIVLPRGDVGFRLVPYRAVTRRLDIEAVFVDQRATEGGADRYQRRDHHREDHDVDRRDHGGVIAAEPPHDVGQRQRGNGAHDGGVSIDGATSLRPAFGGFPGVHQTRHGGEHRDGGSTDEDPGGRVPELSRPCVAPASGEGDDVERGRKNVRRDRDVGERRVQWLTGPATQALERAALERQRRAYRELPHAVVSFVPTIEVTVSPSVRARLRTSSGG